MCHLEVTSILNVRVAIMANLKDMMSYELDWSSRIFIYHVRQTRKACATVTYILLDHVAAVVDLCLWSTLRVR